MDVLADVLDAVRLRASIYFRAFFVPPWGVEVPRQPGVMRFHLVSSGQLWIRVEGEAPVRLEAGMLGLVPHGAAHVLSDTADRPSRPLADLLAMGRQDADGMLHVGEAVAAPGPPDIVVCGHIAFEEPLAHPLFGDLPAVVSLGGAQGGIDAAWASATLKMLWREQSRTDAGGLAMRRRLSEIFFIHAARAYLQRQGERARFVAALADPGLSRALVALHAAPGRAWTVEALAAQAGASRAAFAARFGQMVGLPPIAYLTRWRLLVAARQLRETTRPVKAIAGQAGYGSMRAFERAFAAQFNELPGQYRARLRDAGRG